MCRKRRARRKKFPTPMTIQRVNGAAGALRSNNALETVQGWKRRNTEQRTRSASSGQAFELLRPGSSVAASENHRQLFGRNDFKLGIRTVAGLLVRAPSAKLRGVTEAVTLHVVVSDFDDQFGTQRLPR
jgi:hypothetical protein